MYPKRQLNKSSPTQRCKYKWTALSTLPHETSRKSFELPKLPVEEGADESFFACASV